MLFFLFIAINAYVVAIATLSSLKQRSVRRLLGVLCAILGIMIVIWFSASKLSEKKPISGLCFPSHEISIKTGACTRRVVTGTSVYDAICFPKGATEIFFYDGIIKKYNIDLETLEDVYAFLYETAKSTMPSDVVELLKGTLCNAVFVPCTPECNGLLPCEELFDEFKRIYIEFSSQLQNNFNAALNEDLEDCTGILNHVPMELIDMVLPLFGSSLRDIIWILAFDSTYHAAMRTMSF